MKIIPTLLLTTAFGFCVQTAVAENAHAHDAHYTITITNLTHGMLFTPFMATVHDKDIALFELGASPSDALAHIAEAGDTAPQLALLQASNDVFAVTTASGPLMPGQSITLDITGPRVFNNYHYLSIAAMMVPSNDTFVSLNKVSLPLFGSVTYFAKSYDAGSEINDELCTHVPGPFCGGEGYSPEPGEGFVHPSPSTHGEGDLSTASYRWSDPVAKVTIKKM